jgi:site-specific recombinase XerD
METAVNAFLSALKTEPAYASSTQLAYANDLRVFLKYLNDTNDHSPECDDLNTEQVAKFLETERELGRSKSTLVRRLATLTYFQAFLVKQGLISHQNLYATHQKIQQVVSRVAQTDPPRCLNENQVQELLAILESSPRPRAFRDQAIFLLLLETGLSVASLTALDMTDIDLSARCLHVFLPGVGDLWLDMGEAHKAVEEYIIEGRPNLLHKPGERALFISQMDGRLSRQGVWQILKYWGEQAVPAIPLSPRLVRHSAALRMKRAGMLSTDIQKRLGHQNILSTQALLRRLETTCTS